MVIVVIMCNLIILFSASLKIQEIVDTIRQIYTVTNLLLLFNINYDILMLALKH